jgi:hypothetical protein
MWNRLINLKRRDKKSDIVLEIDAKLIQCAFGRSSGTTGPESSVDLVRLLLTVLRFKEA